MQRDLTDQLLAAVKAHCAGCERIGVAVSGGGDSIALMHLLVRAGVPGVQVATVDHQLRSGSASEAKEVERSAGRLGLPHTTLVWDDWHKRGNLQAAARQARHRLLGDWARDQGLEAVALGHTLDDQAETVLMRLARGSGVDGLAAMAPRRSTPDGLAWLRPLLSERRSELRAWLRAEGIGWIDDPSNDDSRFDRVRARRLLENCADLGVTASGLAETAERMAAAAKVLDAQAVAASIQFMRAEAGAIWFEDGLWGLPDDTRWRLLAAAHCQVSGNLYRPRIAALRQGETAVRSGRAHTLHGCIMVPEADGVRIQPELKVLTGIGGTIPGPWASWHISGPQCDTGQCGPLGPKGLAELADWRTLGLPYDLAQTLPGIWRDEFLLGAPLFGLGPWTATPRWGRDEFNSLFISH